MIELSRAVTAGKVPGSVALGSNKVTPQHFGRLANGQQSRKMEAVVETLFPYELPLHQPLLLVLPKVPDGFFFVKWMHQLARWVEAFQDTRKIKAHLNALDVPDTDIVMWLQGDAGNPKKLQEVRNKLKNQIENQIKHKLRPVADDIKIERLTHPETPERLHWRFKYHTWLMEGRVLDYNATIIPKETDVFYRFSMRTDNK